MLTECHTYFFKMFGFSCYFTHVQPLCSQSVKGLMIMTFNEDELNTLIGLNDIRLSGMLYSNHRESLASLARPVYFNC